MRILMFSWEYPPHVVGGLGRHVEQLTAALARDGHEVHLITRAGRAESSDEITDEGVHVVRVADAAPTLDGQDLLAWVLAANGGMQAAATQLLRTTDIDCIHAHDWLVVSAAARTRHTFGLPLVGTVHATEYGRHQGYLPGRMNKLIHQLEWWLTYESRRVITCSQYMADQCDDIFELPAGKITVIPNGVDAAWYARPDLRLVDGDTAPQVLFAGRLEYEKGVQVLLRSFSAIRESFPTAELTIAGDGTYAPALHTLAAELGLQECTHFTGFLDRSALRDAYHRADVVAVPSIYEPFGMVALEAMAAGAGLVVSDTGGLRDVRHPQTPAVAPFDETALADAIASLLADDMDRRRIAHDQAARARDLFSWQTVARDTATEYERAITQERALRSGMSTVPAQRPLGELLASSTLLQSS